MKKIVTTYLFCLCAMVANAANHNECILVFYKTYLYNTLMNNDNKELCKRYLTPDLIKQMECATYITGADAIIRAQDATPDTIETLSVSELGNNWYMVSFCGNRDFPTDRVEIPIKMEHGLITYIVPEWNGTTYGDSTIQTTEYPTIDTISIPNR